MVYRQFSIFSLLGLCACGGTSSPINIDPIASSGFAAQGDVIARGDSFTVTDIPRIVSEGDQLDLETQDITFNILSGTNDVSVTIDGVTYLLASQGNGLFTFEDGDNRVQVFRIGDALPEAEIIEAFSFVDDRLNTSQFVVGFDTDPDDIAAATGSATMTGQIFITARNGFDDGFGEGEIEITADFDDNSVSGSFDIGNSDLGEQDFEVPDASFDLDDAAIRGNGFSGTLTQTAGDLGGTVSDATYDGRFFGQEGTTAGGQISAIVTIPELDKPTFIEGAFLASE